MSDKSKITEEELVCNYSGLPSPLSYCADYDSMGNHGRFPTAKPKKINGIKEKVLKLFKSKNG